MDYVTLLKELFPKKETQGFTTPVLTYDVNGWSFGSSHFENREQAEAERKKYWRNDSGVHSDENWELPPPPPSPLSPDADLEPLEP